ncbi:MAG: hypothetical protein ABIQ88_16280 [Chitinophagaceae bacterium]
MKQDTNKHAEKFPVREGKEESSILHGKKPASKNTYPQLEEKDTQAKTQPEFTEEQSNRKSPDTPAGTPQQ